MCFCFLFALRRHVRGCGSSWKIAPALHLKQGLSGFPGLGGPAPGPEPYGEMGPSLIVNAPNQGRSLGPDPCVHGCYGGTSGCLWLCCWSFSSLDADTRLTELERVFIIPAVAMVPGGLPHTFLGNSELWPWSRPNREKYLQKVITIQGKQAPKWTEERRWL